jgi:hypothetical protein
MSNEFAVDSGAISFNLGRKIRQYCRSGTDGRNIDRIIHPNQRARHNPYGAKAKQLCLEAANRRIRSVTASEKVKQCAKQ